MIWVFCKQCKHFHRLYPTTVMRCPYCGVDFTEWDKHKYECNNDDDVLRQIKDCGYGSTFKTEPEPDWLLILRRWGV